MQLKMGQLHWGRQVGTITYLLLHCLIICMGQQDLWNLDQHVCYTSRNQPKYNHYIIIYATYGHFTSRNWPKCSHYICDYMQLLVICNNICTFLQPFLVLVIFATPLQLICDYFGGHPFIWTTFNLVFIHKEQFMSH
jgi:hypothetical protein